MAFRLRADDGPRLVVLRQLDILFSGCYDLFENESDVYDCLKMFALCLNKYKIALDQGITF